VLTSKNRNEDFYALFSSQIALYLINRPSSVRRILHIVRTSAAGRPVY
jgi:hypothetical protein